ncbi:YopX family protein (plasmid) [Bacillus mycoides]|uniref:YopX family protein n=1 Tax=Bacillus mycoides TaxID=1405 RepID=UPI003CF96EB8
MREIKFRGRKINSTEWVCGDLKKTQNGNAGISVNGKLYIVYADTVGQYTGLKGKDNKEIYEGDILKDLDELPLYIEFSEKRAAFCFVDKFDRYGKCLYTTKDLHWEDFEVVGNLHDNPELLEIENSTK